MTTEVADSDQARAFEKYDQTNKHPRRMSWIGIDYFHALREEELLSDKEFRRIPSHIDTILSLRYSPDGNDVAAATADGSIGIYEVQSGECKHFINKTVSASPATALRFRANLATEEINSVLLSVYTNGHITEWNYVTGEKIRHLVESNNQLLTVDFRSDYKAFATAGSDHRIRIYDESTGSNFVELLGHSNRVFSVRFKPDDHNVLLSGGWDNNVKVWDVRTPQEPAGVIFGPHICGDGIDIADNSVVTAAWSPSNPLQTWDLRTMKCTEILPWQHSMLYCAEFSKTGPTKIAAGGVKSNEFRVFEATDAGYQEIYQAKSEGTYSIDCSPSCEEVAVAGSGNRIGIFKVKKKKYREFTAVGFRKVLKT